MVVHKTMQRKELLKLGYMGWFDRAVCNRNVHQPDIGRRIMSRLWRKVTCKHCLKHKD